LLILRLTLAFWTAGNWPDNDIAPFVLTRNLLRTVSTSGPLGGTTTPEEPDELRLRIGLITAVALTVMAQRTDLRYHNEQTLCYEDCVELAAPRLAIFTTHTVDEETINAYTLGLRTANEGALTAEHVQDTIAGLTTGDPFASLYPLMAERGYDASRLAPNQFHIHGDFSNPEQVALDAMGVIEEQDKIAVWASNSSGDWTLVAWQRPDMVTVNHRAAKNHDRWRHQRLQQLMGPAAVAAALKQGGPGNLPDIVLPKHLPTSAARAVLSALGIDPSEPPIDGPGTAKFTGD
jgi:hypothetical protein